MNFKKIIRKEIQNKFFGGLAFHKSEICKKLHFEHSDVFEYKSEMYDVVKTKYDLDSVYFLCWPDNEGTELNKSLNTLVLNSLSNDFKDKDKEESLNDFTFEMFFNGKYEIKNDLSRNKNYSFEFF